MQLIGEDVDEAYLNELKQVTVDKEMVKANADKLKIIYTPLHGTGKMLYDRAFRQGGFDNVIPIQNFQQLLSLTQNIVMYLNQALSWLIK